MTTNLNTTKNTWYEDYLDKFDEAFTDEEREYLNGWAAYFNGYINSYEMIVSEADDLIELINDFRDNYLAELQVYPETLCYYEVARDAKEIDTARDALEDLVRNADDLYICAEMEYLLVSWEPEEFAKRVKEERSEFGDKLLNDRKLSDLALEYIEHVMIAQPEYYPVYDLVNKLDRCGIDRDLIPGH